MHLEHLLVLRRLIHLEVIQELAAVCDFTEQPAAGAVVLLVILQVLGEHLDLGGQDRDLHLRRAGVLFVGLRFLNQLLLFRALEGHRER